MPGGSRGVGVDLASGYDTASLSERMSSVRSPRCHDFQRFWPPRKSMHSPRVATAEKNFIAVNFLQWFVSEQLEEISSAQTILSVIKRAGPSVLDGGSLSGPWVSANERISVGGEPVRVALIIDVGEPGARVGGTPLR